MAVGIRDFDSALPHRLYLKHHVQRITDIHRLTEPFDILWRMTMRKSLLVITLTTECRSGAESWKTGEPTGRFLKFEESN